MTHPLSIDGAVELAVVERNGLVESRHLGAAVVVDGDGAPLVGLGDPASVIYPRSALKPLQALSVRRSGLRLEGAEAVLSTASHAGTPEHVALARSILSRAGLGEDALRCPAALPLDPPAARAASGPSRIAHNCSGKHAAFLAATVATGQDAARYLEPGVPLQGAVVDTIEELSGERIAHHGVDGCGAPLHALSILGLARALGRMPRDPEGTELLSAVLGTPWAIDGEGRPNSVVIEECGIVAKGGAEGVLVAVAGDGTAVALKILDGGARAATLVALRLLVRVGAVDPDAAQRAAERTTERVLGGERTVGRIRVGPLVDGG